eukprot:TRINITY_DN3874_c1_g1_i1.p1 TRINITY_DN3874_c1_g1~~TRINITY_DN3874_c1_g1_i1.p1  ORF type:complete len:100 (-),score=14.35 TRINITY_DN3874_c1_g1_i1:63-362(-)
MLSRLQAVADARAQNLLLRPAQTRPSPEDTSSKMLKTPLNLVLAFDQSASDWERIERRSELTTALSKAAEDVSTIWSGGDHYSMLTQPHCNDLAKAILR